MKFAVIKTGGKQYVVTEGEEIIVDKIDAEQDAKVELETLATGDFENDSIELGTPTVKKAVQAQVLETGKGDKLRVARFKAKVRYRKVTGFRPMLSRLKILSI